MLVFLASPAQWASPPCLECGFLFLLLDGVVHMVFWFLCSPTVLLSESVDGPTSLSVFSACEGFL